MKGEEEESAQQVVIRAHPLKHDKHGYTKQIETLPMPEHEEYLQIHMPSATE